MPSQLLIAGGGLGGLAAATACARAGWEVGLHEQAAAFSEAGAGIQLGPNATRILQAWDLGETLRAVSARPTHLRIRDAAKDAELASLPLGEDIEKRYGAPYLTVHRADLHGVLLEATRRAGPGLHPGSRIEAVTEHDRGVSVRTRDHELHADALVVADGIWSALRGAAVDAGPARATGHVAFRSLAPQAQLPASCRSDEVNVWLGPRMHVVAYPVRGGDWLNMVALVEAPGRADARDWDQAGTAAELAAAMGPCSVKLRDRVDAMQSWRVWTLHDRDPLRGAGEMARGRIALLGDAAHPMLPYLAQGAGMAIEDAAALAQVLGAGAGNVPAELQRYAQMRWRRSARVQRAARRNAAVFHATGPLRWARDAALSALGPRLLDQPWLYR